MGFDAVRGIDTYGSGCMPGAVRMFEWFQRTYHAGSLGCYNPASRAGGGPSLHAEGRAMDIALNANDPLDRERGDAIFSLVVSRPEIFGAQEMLFRGYIWSWQRRGEGRRGPGIQQSEHMNHVHLGIDVEAAKNWTEDWLEGLDLEEDDDMAKHTVEDLVKYVEWGLKNVLEGKGVDGNGPKALFIDDVKKGVAIALRDPDIIAELKEALK